MNRLTGFVLTACLLALAACSKPEPSAQPAPAPPATEPVPEPAADETTRPRNDAEVINFEGFGPAKFGANEEQVRISWGRPLQAGTPAPGASCYQLFMDPKPEGGNGIAFLFEDGKFARYDVDVPQHVAPGGFSVGARAEDILAAFAGRIEVQPHKYVEGARNLIVSPADGGAARLIFEVDAAGAVSSWRIGVSPQIYYVEGCG